MASKTGMFLDEEERARLIRGLESYGEVQRSSQVALLGNDTGCLICGNDDDHNNLMLCEGCNDEYHTYCLDPPLPAVPPDDWFCDRCSGKSIRKRKMDDDGLSDRVLALPREFTSRFGEVCFAYGGFGFGWWPSCIFDPRLTEGSARQTARKNLGKKHLIYFFECHETPFAVMSSNKIVSWNEGLAENYHLGKTAKAAGKQRALQFQQALQAAVIEDGKPLEQRLDWNRAEDQPQLLPLPKKGKKGDAGPSSPQKTKDNNEPPKTSNKNHKKKKRNPLFCRIMKKTSADDAGTNIGFVKLASARKSTFADARKAMEKELVPEALSRTAKWKFHVTTLGPVSLTQEESLGPLLPFLRSGIGGNATNGGSIEDPITVMILEDGNKSQQSTTIKK